MRRVGGSLVHDLGGAVGERAVDDVAVPGDPADVGGAPVDIRLGVQVEDVLVGVRDLGEISAARVQDAFRLPRGAGGVQDEQRVLGLEAARLVLGIRRLERVVPPDVAALGPVDLVLAAAHHEHVLHGARVAVDGVGGQRRVDGALESEHAALAPAAVGGDDELRLRVVDAGAQALGAEPAEDDGVHGAEARDSEHGDDGLRDDRQVDRDAVALADAERFERVGGALHLGGEFSVGEAAGVARLALPVDGDPVPVAGGDVPVEAVLGDVQLAVAEPARKRRVRPVEGLGERGLPMQELPGLLGPEPEPVGRGGLGEVGRGDRVGGELGARREPAVLVHQAVNRIHGRRYPRSTATVPGGRVESSGERDDPIGRRRPGRGACDVLFRAGTAPRSDIVTELSSTSAISRRISVAVSSFWSTLKPSGRKLGMRRTRFPPILRCCGGARSPQWAPPLCLTGPFRGRVVCVANRGHRCRGGETPRFGTSPPSPRFSGAEAHEYAGFQPASARFRAPWRRGCASGGGGGALRRASDARSRRGAARG